MKRYSLNWVTILMVAIVSVGFVSCGGDDDESTSNHNDEQASTPIIGTWRNDWGSGARSYTAYSFFEDGTGLKFDKGNGAKRFTYTYHSNPQSVDIVYSKYDKNQMAVSQLTSSVLMMNGDEYKKTELTYAMLILGEWYLRVDAHNSSGKGTRVFFVADWNIEGTGTYEAKDYYNDDATDEWYNSFSGLSGKVSGTWSLNEKRLSIKGPSQIAGEYNIEELVVNGCRLVRASSPNEYPYLLGEWHQR